MGNKTIKVICLTVFGKSSIISKRIGCYDVFLMWKGRVYMGIMKKTICPKCGNEYSALRSDCPHCGALRANPSTRTPRSSDAVRKGTRDSARAAVNTRWQFIFGLCLVAAVIIAVIVLITTTINGNYDEPDVNTTPPPSESVEPPSTPPPSTPPPVPKVESITITYFGDERTEFTAKAGSTTQLGATVYPLVEGEVEWSSTDESILTVDNTGLVTAVAPGTASVIARCYEGVGECKVVVIR